MNEPNHIFWMVPIMGYFQLSLFAGYAIYFPELFPTYLRSTGTSFCYNVGRFVAATGPTMLTFLASDVFGGYPEPYPWRYAGVTMCAIFLVGIATLPFATETKDRPLTEYHDSVLTARNTRSLQNDQLASLSEQDRLGIVGYLRQAIDGAEEVEAARDEELARR